MKTNSERTVVAKIINTSTFTSKKCFKHNKNFIDLFIKKANKNYKNTS